MVWLNYQYALKTFNLFSKYTPNTSGYWISLGFAGITPRIIFQERKTATTALFNVSPSILKQGEYALLIVNMDGINDVVEVFVNGEAISQTASTLSWENLLSDESDNEFTISVPAPTNVFNGFLDEPQFYAGKNFTAEEAVALYKRGKLPDDYTQTCKGHWKFDEGSGTSALDASGNGNTGTIVNATYSDKVPLKART